MLRPQAGLDQSGQSTMLPRLHDVFRHHGHTTRLRHDGQGGNVGGPGHLQQAVVGLSSGPAKEKFSCDALILFSKIRMYKLHSLIKSQFLLAVEKKRKKLQPWQDEANLLAAGEVREAIF